MSDIVRVTRSQETMRFNGERMTSAMARSQIEAEHLHRYFLARSVCDDKDVLDIACGEGYGSALLAGRARSVIAFDIDRPTVEHAQRNYRADNLRFDVGDARAIPCADASVDVVVTFETLEHMVEHDTFISEIVRVLRPGGVVVISSPDRDVYSGEGKPENPYHHRELTKGEFHRLLADRFAFVANFSQQAMIGSVMIRDGDRSAEPLTFERTGPDQYEVAASLANAPYCVAVASNAPVAAPSATVYIDLSEFGFIVPEYLHAAERQRELLGENERLTNLLRTAERTSADRAGAIEHLEGVLRAERSQAARLAAITRRPR